MQRRRTSESSSSSSSDEEYKPSQSVIGAIEVKQESQESQKSERSQQSETGVSQDFFDVLNMNDDDVPGLSSQSEAALSVGFVCVVSRPTTNKKQKDIKKFALQKTFYAFPKNCSQEIKNKMQERIENDIADFRIQQYDVSIHRFGLPFEVEEVCCVSRGYTLLPKILKAPRPPSPPSSSTKRKRGRNKEEESDSDTGLVAVAKENECDDSVEQVSGNLRSNAKKNRK